MRAIVNTAPGRLELRELPPPVPGPGQVRIRTAACAICATDLQMIAGWERTGFPAIPGHEWSGTVDAVGAGADPALAGRSCVADNVWAGGGEVGFEHPGGYAEGFLTEAANVRCLPASSDPVAATLIEPLAVCVRGLRRLRADFAAPVLLFGDGPIGLLLTALIAGAATGARPVVLVGGRDRRLALARGFAPDRVRTLNYHALGPDLVRGVRNALPASVFPTVIEASGGAGAMVAALDLAATGARVLVLGDYAGAHAAFAWNQLLHRELELIGSNASAGAWDEAVRLAAGGTVPLRALVSHVLPAAEFARGLELMRSRDPGVVKVVLDWRAETRP